MNQKDYNIFISDISTIVKPLNQLLYQCLILIIFYYLFNTLSFLKNNSKIHKPFIYLIFIICICLDWFMWNNCIQTSLFIAILYIYIVYNFNISTTVSTFIDVMNDSRINHKINKKYNAKMKTILMEQDINSAREQEEMNKITFIPKEFTPIINPEPYEKQFDGINEINSAYSPNINPINIIDLNYADVKLDELRKTPQYKVRNALNEDSIMCNDNRNERINDTSNDDNLNIDLFRNPKRVFLDDKWLNVNTQTYNDICNNCIGTSANENKNKNANRNTKNAICSVPKYGQELEECTNQTSSVNDGQLKIISSNKVEPIYKF